MSAKQTERHFLKQSAPVQFITIWRSLSLPNRLWMHAIQMTCNLTRPMLYMTY